MTSQKHLIPADPCAPDMTGASLRERLIVLWRTNRHLVFAAAIAVGLTAYLTGLPGYVREQLGRGLQFHPFLAGLLLLFGMLALSLLWSTGQRIDSWAFLYFNLRGVRPLWLDRSMITVTQLGNGLFALALGGAAYVLGFPRLGYEVVVGTSFLWLVVEAIKASVCRARPYITLAETRVVGYHEPGRSFPSGHTSQAFFLATFLIQYAHPSLQMVTLLYGLAAAVGVTRMYVGAHYPRDVLAGGILGTIGGTLAALVDLHFWPRSL